MTQAEVLKDRSDQSEFTYDLERMTRDRDYLAEASVRLCDVASSKLMENPQSLLSNHSQIELLARNVASASDRVISRTDITKVPDGYRETISRIDEKAGGLLTACGLSGADDKFEAGRLHVLQGAILYKKLPAEAAGVVSLLLRESTTVITEIITNDQVEVDQNYQRFLAGNISAAANAIEQK